MGTEIKKTAKEILHAEDDSDDEEQNPISKVLNDALMFTHIARFLPNKQIACMELVNRQSFISLRQYPALIKLENGHWVRNRHLIRIGAIHPECSTPQDLVNELDDSYGLQVQ